ncbi:metal ABC transporter permease [Allofustis seminis]|uniref:metal ABC transporter permease n=1 Tax=Allofustis seminis TaxID=166939 RepID=UPI00036D0A16|nr:metal ABC transporter permease [Allofustis seminis]
MNALMMSTLIILVLAGLTCANIGTFVVLRNQSMITDALSHTVLLGIVIAFLIVPNMDSPLLQVGAALVGVLTVYLIEWIIQKTTVQNDAATGLVFTFLFSVAVIILSKYMRNVHLDVDCVLMGDIIFAPLNTQEFLGMVVPKSIVSTGTLFIVDIIFIALFWKELKISIFDPGFAKTAGIKYGLLNFAFMFLVSLTTVINFTIVGSILVISFFVAPAMTAQLFTKTIKSMYLWTLAIATLNCTIGFFVATALNVSMAGMCATVAFFTFGLCFVAKRWLKYKRFTA